MTPVKVCCIIGWISATLGILGNFSSHNWQAMLWATDAAIWPIPLWFAQLTIESMRNYK